jgi:hypothetical protein
MNLVSILRNSISKYLNLQWTLKLRISYQVNHVVHFKYQEVMAMKTPSATPTGIMIFNVIFYTSLVQTCTGGLI